MNHFVENKFDENEFLGLCRKYNPTAYVRDVTLEYENDSFFNRTKEMVKKDRRGEAVFCVIRPNGMIIATTCAYYPPGVYRIPTGGIGKGENAAEAVLRETKEELGLEADIEEFAGVIRIRFRHRDDSFMFYSYIFILKEKSGRLLVDASDNEVSEVREVDIKGLEEIVHALGNIEESWRDWGRFRQVTSGAVLEYLKTKPFLK